MIVASSSVRNSESIDVTSRETETCVDPDPLAAKGVGRLKIRFIVSGGMPLHRVRMSGKSEENGCQNGKEESKRWGGWQVGEGK